MNWIYIYIYTVSETSQILDDDVSAALVFPQALGLLFSSVWNLLYKVLKVSDALMIRSGSSENKSSYFTSLLLLTLFVLSAPQVNKCSWLSTVFLSIHPLHSRLSWVDLKFARKFNPQLNEKDDTKSFNLSGLI